MLFLSPDRTAYTKTVWNTQASYTHKKALFLDPFAVAYGDFGVDRTAEMDSISAVSTLILYAKPVFTAKSIALNLDNVFFKSKQENCTDRAAETKVTENIQVFSKSFPYNW